MNEQPNDVWISVTRMDSTLSPFTKGYATAVPGPLGTAVLQVEFNLTAYIRHVIAEQSVTPASDL